MRQVAAGHRRVVAVSAVSLGALVLSGLPAVATPSSAPAGTSEPAGPAGGEAGSDTLTAPDAVTAQTMARLRGEPVEVLGDRSEVSSTWAMPDGTMRSGIAAGPVWVREGGDGTEIDDWAAVDLTLEATAAGVEPVAHPAGLVLAGGGGAPANGELVSMRGPDGQRMALEWSGALPTPRLEGPRAVYPGVTPGVDLVIEVTRTGYEQFYVVQESATDGGLDLPAMVVSTEGMTVSETVDGGLDLVGAGNEVVASSGTPMAWDAEVDAEREQPLTQPWQADEDVFRNFGSPEDVTFESPTPSSPPAGPAAVPGVLPPLSGPVASAPVVPEEQGSPRDGQVADPAAAAARASDLLEMDQVFEVTSPTSAQVELVVDQSFLDDPGTQFPVVVDPQWDFTLGFDTWVQSGTSSDQSGSGELRLGTFNSGGTVARSFINFNMVSEGRDLRSKSILAATLRLWEFHSWSCTPAKWEVHATDPASTGTRWNAQPTFYGKYGESTQTLGYSSSCAAGEVQADLTNLIRTWSNQGQTAVGFGLKAESETSDLGWKKFYSGNSGAPPLLWVAWNTPPSASTDVKVSNGPGAAVDGIQYTQSLTPQVSAIANDVDNDQTLKMHLQVHKSDRSVLVDEKIVNGLWNGSVGRATVGPPALTNGGEYQLSAHTWDGVNWNSANSGYHVFRVDSTPPTTPSVASTQYPAGNTWQGGTTTAGTFTFTPGVSSQTGWQGVSHYLWGINEAPSPANKVLASSPTLSWTPPSDGRFTLQVVAYDLAGNASPLVKYAFNVGQAGLSSPEQGDQVVRRVRLAVGGSRLTPTPSSGSAAALTASSSRSRWRTCACPTAPP